MFTDATALELVLLFLVACIGIPSIALAIAAVAEVVVLKMRHAEWKRRQQRTSGRTTVVHGWPDRAGSSH